MNTYHVLGLMSGSSMDGLDIAYCKFTENDGQWGFEILDAETVPFPKKWQLRLRQLVMQNAVTYIKTHTYFGHYLGEEINAFVDKRGIRDKVDFVASHGQTIFHQPENMLTSQIGDGAAIAALTGFKVYSNFRTKDVALGGQGAPIVPIGDKLLFADYTFCLNLGGIANISMIGADQKMLGYDICAVNLVMNRLAEQAGQPFDRGGEIGRSGEVDSRLLDELNDSWYYKKEPPKTLGGGWVRKVLMPIVKRHPIDLEDKMRTVVEHIAQQIAADVKILCDDNGISDTKSHKMLVTGGGAFNDFLMERISKFCPVEVIRPSAEIIDFKEAVIIGLMGALRDRNEVNCLASVTGASQDSVGGEHYV